MSQAYFFPCPTCGETIGSNTNICRFCNSPIDPQVALAAIDTQLRINHACNDASMIRNIAGFMWIAVLIQFLYATTGRVLFVGMMIIVPVKLISWHSKYSSIKTEDVDFKTARNNWKLALYLWLPTPIVLIVLIALVVASSR